MATPGDMDGGGVDDRDGQAAGAGDGDGDGDEACVIESLILAVAHHWSRRETIGRQVELIERHFSQDEMKMALWKLHRCVDAFDKPKNRVGGAAKTATTLQAEDLVRAITELGDKDKLPRFVVQSDDLCRIGPLLNALSISDERSVATRLEALEAAQQRNMMELKKLMTSSPASLQNPTITVTTPHARIPTPRGGLQASTGAVIGADAGAGAEQHRAKPSYADKAGRALEIGAAGGDSETPSFFHRQARADQRGNLNVGARTHRSTSSKRRRLDDAESVAGSSQLAEESKAQESWRSQGRQRKTKARPKVNTGRASGDGFLDLEGPAHFWIGNTRADTNPEKVKDVLQQAAAKLEIQGFRVEEALCLTKGDAPRTKSWKVSVPARMREHMQNPEIYPAGWAFRTFTKWSKRAILRRLRWRRLLQMGKP